MNTYFNPQDAPNSKMAEIFATIDGKRYSMMNAKDFEAKANVEIVDVPILGKIIKGKKATGLEITIKMTVYKCSEMFDELIERFKSTGVLPVFDIQTTNEDPATSMGRSSKIYTDCVIDGDVLLSMFDADGEFIEQEINCYAMDFRRPEKYRSPSYM